MFWIFFLNVINNNNKKKKKKKKKKILVPKHTLARDRLLAKGMKDWVANIYILVRWCVEY